jgi:hypothetical protein
MKRHAWSAIKAQTTPEVRAGIEAEARSLSERSLSDADAETSTNATKAGQPVFAYGSNMCRGRLLDYKVHPEGPGQPAQLRGYVLRLNKVGRRRGRRSGKGNIEQCPAETVWGVLYTIPDHELTVLDAGEGPGYQRVRLRVESSGGPVDAWVHVAKEPSNDPDLRPYGWYKRFIVEGARSHGLPAEYVAKLEAIEADDDPDQEWERNRRSLTCD